MRGDHGEVVGLLIKEGGKVVGQEGQLIDLEASRLMGNVRIFGELDPEWEVRGRLRALRVARGPGFERGLGAGRAGRRAGRMSSGRLRKTLRQPLASLRSLQHTP